MLLAVASAVLFVDLGQPLGLHQNDEDFYFGVAREMAARGDYGVPTWEGRLAFEKPPLLYWLMMPFMALCGPDLLAARLPVALCALLAVLATVGLGRRLFGSDAGLAAGWVVLTSFGFLQYGRVGMMDVPLTLLVVLFAWGAWEFRMGRASGAYGAGVAAALATMLKGPVGAIIPAVAVVLMAGASRWIPRGEEAEAPDLPARAGAHVVGAMLVAGALVVAWPAALWARGLGPTWVAHFIVGENLGKFEGARTSVAYMLKGFLVLLAPWTLLLVGGAVASCRRLSLSRPSTQLAWAFAIATLFVYSLPRVKWAQYLLPALPFVAMLLGTAASAPRGAGRLLRGLSTITGGMFLVAAAGAVLGVRLLPSLREGALLVSVGIALAGAGVALCRGPRIPLAGVCLGVVLVAGLGLAPALTMQRVPPDLEGIARGRELATYAVPPYFLQVQLHRPVRSIGTGFAFREAIERGDRVVVGQTEMQELMAQGHLDPGRTRVILCWRKWRRHLHLPDVVRTLVGGRLDDLTESVNVLEKSPSGP